MTHRRLAAAAFAVLSMLACAGCGKKKVDDAKVDAAPAAMAATTGAATAATAPAAVATPPGAPPADGKYERVTVDGVTVPMVQVMNGGAIVLVDTDGVKPRSWEEQYKRKRELPNGQYDLHKTNANKNDTFEDDAIDKEGLWVIDAKGNLAKH